MKRPNLALEFLQIYQAIPQCTSFFTYFKSSVIYLRLQCSHVTPRVAILALHPSPLHTLSTLSKAANNLSISSSSSLDSFFFFLPSFLEVFFLLMAPVDFVSDTVSWKNGRGEMWKNITIYINICGWKCTQNQNFGIIFDKSGVYVDILMMSKKSQWFK